MRLTPADEGTAFEWPAACGDTFEDSDVLDVAVDARSGVSGRILDIVTNVVFAATAFGTGTVILGGSAQDLAAGGPFAWPLLCPFIGHPFESMVKATLPVMGVMSAAASGGA